MRLDAGVLAEALTVALAHGPIAADQVVAGSPIVGTVVLDDSDGVEIGVWEMTPGTATDTEIDEVFVVIAGRATVEFENGQDVVELAPGSVVRLEAGMRTTWTVHETLRKVYVA
ncbi:MAG: cupin domain-containing protein [Pseudolysinimonas sp.]